MKILVVSHGAFAQGLVETSQMIAGVDDNVSYLSLKETDNVDDFSEKVLRFLKSTSDEVLILADLLGGSPMLSSARAMNSLDNMSRVAMITGVNLPILLELVTQIKLGERSLSDIVGDLPDVGKEGIVVLRKEERG